MTPEQFEKISKWQDKTFGKATAMSKVAHLKEEVNELNNAIWADAGSEINHSNIRAKRMEFADCFILLFGAAASDGMTHDDIINCIEEKMQINYKRKWGKPKANGVVNHIK